MTSLTIVAAASMLTVACSTEKYGMFKLHAMNQPLLTDEVKATVDKLYASMSADERLQQLRSINLWEVQDKDGHLDTALCRKLIGNGIGHIAQFASQSSVPLDSLRDQVAEAQEWLQKNTPHGIPALFHEEVITGVTARDATVYPQQIGLACSFNPTLAEQKTRFTAQDLRALGGHQALSPMADVCRNPHFNRLEESYGEDGYLSAAMGVAFVRGLQHGGLRQGVAACSKHFLGYGGGGDAPEKELFEDILLPHEAMIRVAGEKVVMTGYHKFHGKNCVESQELMEDILRSYLHFDGMMVSDYGSVGQIEDAHDDVERAALAINGGNDVDFQEGACYKYLPEAQKRGLVADSTIEKAVKRVLTMKVRLGLLDKDARLYATGHLDFDRPEERQLSYDLATQSVVLLQNNGVLPLKGQCNILLTGPNADGLWAMCGDYTYQGMKFFWRNQMPTATNPKIVSLKEGMAQQLPEGASLDYARGCDWTNIPVTKIVEGGDPRTLWVKKLVNRHIPWDEEADAEAAIEKARKADIIVAAMGENTMLCGENRDRESLRLPSGQEQFVERLLDTGKPVVLIIFGGRAQVISNIAARCAAIIQAWYPGEEGGNALADIIYGNVSPSGKLSVSYPNRELDEPLCYNYQLGHNPKVAWPFGYGLSYNHYRYSNLKMDQVVKTGSNAFSLSMDVKNEGDYPSEEIVQLYLSPEDKNLPLKPIQLIGFTRVPLKSGETKTVRFHISPQQLGYYDHRHWQIAPGRYRIRVGASSQDFRLEGIVTLKGSEVTMPLRTVYFSETY